MLSDQKRNQEVKDEHPLEYLESLRDFKIEFVRKSKKNQDINEILRHDLLKPFKPAAVANPQKLAKSILSGEFDSEQEDAELTKMSQSVLKVMLRPEMQSKLKLLKKS